VNSILPFFLQQKTKFDTQYSLGIGNINNSSAIFTTEFRIGQIQTTCGNVKKKQFSISLK
jgi:hypothetical protein